ncbi:tRNA (N6-isopentenyl adenosine(37)-C2)-methylthiotransferase MiaB [Pseudoflavonifractor capillosus]|uniref:tRNA (N6-isopentenyl adenosine(37)-C2)-methylthiotransferase MiaB n=1 Tax=Pseudoflavonifractor capillosus TaxID=106588 RepID=UPI00195BC3B9|nr:tRNA (N6-isopentenyl adenosine(37)-C2)-methylthiotransferase MiaB [Pseudoflavonifractor capillosus]MBM6897475.1 tRNA (N6-isopentenyl adenosine(37)-C2)-methylthiotransferase MiaB [Pseudoflavonifractor capillosus]
MERKTPVIPAQDVARQRKYCQEIRAINAAHAAPPTAFVDTYGCQQNEADSELLRGMLCEMGYEIVDSGDNADLILINTCAIREHAEQRVFGNVGALVHGKRRNPNQIICLCGCMAQEPHVVERLRQSYQHVDLVFGPQVLWRFPEFMRRIYLRRGRVFETAPAEGAIAEGLPVRRSGKIKAWVSIMYGCNNFCTYCIVPYTRGRERSREPEIILNEIRQLVAEGYKDITLLGQNVNSYGKDLGTGMDFPTLLEQANAIPGEFLLRFMTSHPKDATERLFDVMAACEKVAPCIHLPFQSGNTRVLSAMNRRYTREQYLEKVYALRQRIPNVVLTSDVIVGFPGETTPEFEDTLSLIEEVRYDALFTFIYSPRKGTPAAEMEDPMSKEEKSANFNRLVEAQNRISLEKHQEYIGTVQHCLVDGESEDPRNNLNARTPGGRLVHLNGDVSLVGQFVDVKITDCSTWALFGETYLNE